MSVVREAFHMSEKYNIFVIVMYVVLSLITLASLLVIFLLGYIFKQNKGLINNSVNIFILNIIFVDLLRCLIQMPVFSFSIHLALDELNNVNNNAWTSSKQKSDKNYLLMIVGCNLNITISVMLEIVQLLSFLAMSYERYKIVHSPFLNSNKRFFLAKILLVLTWFIAIGLTGLLVLIISIFSGIFSKFLF